MSLPELQVDHATSRMNCSVHQREVHLQSGDAHSCDRHEQEGEGGGTPTVSLILMVDNSGSTRAGRVQSPHRDLLPIAACLGPGEGAAVGMPGIGLYLCRVGLLLRGCG